ncbi:MAG: hypothetical protein DRG09_00285 [Epsilonproteobacteria bacterium]|nr:MAG: hypothetical protein DRG09_00285 [Campylobacterota bacterium]
MRSINTYYTTKENLGSFIRDEKIENSSSLLIQVFSALTDRDFISTLLLELSLFLPDAVIIGTTTDGEIMNGKVSSGKVVLNFTQFKETTLKAAATEHEVNGFFSGKYLAEELISEESKLFIAFVDGLHTNGESFLNGISTVNDDILVAGGYAGDNNKMIETLVFTKDRILARGAVAVTLNNKNLHVHTDYSFNWHPIGNELTITKAEDNRVYTIDGKKSVDTYAHYLGDDIAKGLPSVGIEFPLIVNRNGSDISRIAMAKKEDGSLIIGGNLYVGEKVRIGYGVSKDILNKSKKILEVASKKPSEAIFVYSCSARKYFMGDEIESEILPLQDISPVAGFFTYGEFFTSNKKELLNQTMTLVSLSESDTVHEVSTESSLKSLNINQKSMNGLTHLINITSQELKETNKLNQQLKERMELALLGSKTSVLDWDFTTNDFYISPSWKEMLGYRDDELKNSTYTWLNRVHPKERKDIFNQLRDTEKKQLKYFENIHRLKHKDGHWVWVMGRAQIIYDEEAKRVRMVGTHTDITEEKELQLKYSHQAQMISQMHETVNTTDLKGYITSWNNGSELTYGYKAEEVIGKHISLLYSSEEYEKFVKSIPVLMQEGEHRTTLSLIKKSKETVLISLSLSLLRDDNGVPTEIVGYGQDVTELHKQKDILYYQAHYDALTNLPNRVLFRERLTHNIELAERNKTGFALFFIDIDKFKNINDSLGHDVGDKVLKAVSKRLESIIRKEDTLARLGGDEFTVIMDDLHHSKDATILAKKVLNVLAEPLYIDDNMLYVTGSIGISHYPEDAVEAEYLLKYADTAMYKAKEEGRDNYQFYSSEMTKQALDHMSMKTSLQQAIDNDEFIVHYQPQINTLDNTLVGLEALVRWQHPEKGLIFPDAFIPMAEETGLIIKIDKIVMRKAMKQMSKWYKAGLNPGLLAINLSVQQLECQNFVEQIKERIKIYNFKAEWLELEITEGQMMRRPEEVIRKLTEIHDLGVSISIDDFGTGYSSLSLLKRLPINRLKIDRSFVKDLPKDEDDVAIVQAIIALADSLNLDLIAEGVETSEQKDFLTKNHSNYVQGYLYSPPLNVNKMRDVLLERKI